MQDSNILIDCDPGLDDVLALIAAKYFFSTQLKAVTTCYGNASIEKTTQNACLALQMLNLDCPIYKGASEASNLALNNKLHQYWQSFGDDDGVLGVDLVDKTGKSCEVSHISSGDFLQAISKIIAIAPLTNIANFSLHNRLKNVQLFTLGSYFNLHKVARPRLSYNIKLDPAACQVAFNSYSGITVTGLDIYGGWTEDSFDELFILASKLTTKSARLLTKAVVAYRQHHMDASALLVDSLPVFAAAHPELFTWLYGRVSVQTEFYPQAEFLQFEEKESVSLCQIDNGNAFVRVAKKIDLTEFKKYWLDIMQKI